MLYFFLPRPAPVGDGVRFVFLLRAATGPAATPRRLFFVSVDRKKGKKAPPAQDTAEVLTRERGEEP